MNFETKGQKWFMGVFTVVLFAVVLVIIGLNVWAFVTCVPQAGKWTPWTGKICYGEHE